MRTVVSSVQSKTLAGRITGLDLTNDGELVAAALERSDGGPSVQLFRVADLSLQAEYARDVQAARGVAFVEDDGALVFVTHRPVGATLLFADGGAPRVIAEYPTRQAEQLVRDATGQRVGIIGDSFIVWSVEQAPVVGHVVGDAGDAGARIYASFAAHGHRAFLYGSKAGKIVLRDLATDEDVGEWDAPYKFGSFVASSPSDRYVVAIGYNGQGVFVVDTERRCTLAQRFFNEDAFWDKQPLFTGDESVLFTWAQNGWLFEPPEFEWQKGPPMTGATTTAAASARKVPLLAFGVDRDELRLVRFARG